MIGGTNTGGAGLNLHIVGSNTRPLVAVENMLWINTETRIPNWYWQPDTPASPNEGDLWINPFSLATNQLDLLRNNNLIVGIGRTQQYTSGAWADVGGGVFYNGDWHDLQTYVYNRGVFNESVGGTPWGTWGTGTFSNNTTNGWYRVYDGTGGIHPKNKIDLTEVKKIKITFTVTGLYNGSDNKAGYAISLSKNTNSYANCVTSATWTTGVSYTSHSTPYTLTVDVSGSTYNDGFWINFVNYIYQSPGSRTEFHLYSIELIS